MGGSLQADMPALDAIGKCQKHSSKEPHCRFFGGFQSLFRPLKGKSPEKIGCHWIIIEMSLSNSLSFVSATISLGSPAISQDLQWSMLLKIICITHASWYFNSQSLFGNSWYDPLSPTQFLFYCIFFWGWEGALPIAAKKTSVGGYFNLVPYVINLFLKLSCLQSVHIKDAASYACEREKWTRFIRILRKDFVPSK